jgi:hypothetical protein
MSIVGGADDLAQIVDTQSAIVVQFMEDISAPDETVTHAVAVEFGSPSRLTLAIYAPSVTDCTAKRPEIGYTVGAQAAIF